MLQRSIWNLTSSFGHITADAITKPELQTYDIVFWSIDYDVIYNVVMGWNKQERPILALL